MKPAARLGARSVRVVARAVPFVGLVVLGVWAGTAMDEFTSRRGSADGIRELARNRDWARAGVRSPAAGLSIVTDPDIKTLRPGRLGQLAETEAYHAFRHRCSSCHDPPDPSMHDPGEWRGIVRRMGDWMRAARLMPMAPADTAAIGSFLERAAGR